MKVAKIQQKVWQKYPQAATGLAVATALSVAQDKSFLIVTEDTFTARHLVQEIKFFLGDTSRFVTVFPNWETLPYDHFSPHADAVSKRLLTLYNLQFVSGMVVVVDVATLMQRLPPPAYVAKHSFIVGIGDEFDLEHWRTQLMTYGYRLVDTVMEQGEFAVRGSIIDVFPMGSDTPYRINLLYTAVESIHTFDPDTQRSLQVMSKIHILPAQEFPWDETSRCLFMHNWEQHFTGDPTRCPIYESVAADKMIAGLEYYLPLFFAETVTLDAYFPQDKSIVITIGNIKDNMQKFWHEITLRHMQLCHDQTRPLLMPQELFIEPEQMSKLLVTFQSPQLEDINSFTAHNLQDLFELSDTPSKLTKLHSWLQVKNSVKKRRVLIVAISRGRQEVLIKFLYKYSLTPTLVNTWQEFMQGDTSLAMIVTDIERPMYVKYKDTFGDIIMVTEEWLLGVASPKSPTKVLASKKLDILVRNLTSLQSGEFVVHIDYGIGRYLGLQKLQLGEISDEFLVLEYAEDAKLYVPVSSLDLITRYTGIANEQVKLQHLGTKQWDKIKAQAARQIRDTAAELLEIHAARKAAQGFSFTLIEEEYARFIANFPFVTTVDQKRAIDDVLSDMCSGRMMDRVICGDVGFGKTEVAMRAAFVGASCGKQVAILTPTTLLAKQHYTNFQERFAEWPLNIALYSRLGAGEKLTQTIIDLRLGKVDIVIGTHKLLQKQVQFKNLGLLIVDEEHRFGVRHKEYIKQMAQGVDILTLTATPIPRTLNMAFAGIRDISLIASPPARRLAIKTLICEYSVHIIKEAIIREILRGGQVYFVHNNITNIAKIARDLAHLVPQAKIAIAHGQMRKQELEHIMQDFYHLHTNVLVCTTIIESGLDIPTANTIIINRADRMGLAQLHQLRGRVGRSEHQAYAYLIVPEQELLSKDAHKRLTSIATMKDLGTGFALAIHDLEIRGAGELLGEKQSGVICGIGFTLYTEMLTRAVKAIKRGEKMQNMQEPYTMPQIDLKLAAYFPDDYIHDVNLRLVFYKRIASATALIELDDIRAEIWERFGILPEIAQNLFKLATLKLHARNLAITKIAMNACKGTITFAADCNLEPQLIIPTLRKYKLNFKFSSTHVIEFTYESAMIGIDLLLELLASFTDLK